MQKTGTRGNNQGRLNNSKKTQYRRQERPTDKGTRPETVKQTKKRAEQKARMQGRKKTRASTRVGKRNQTTGTLELRLKTGTKGRDKAMEAN